MRDTQREIEEDLKLEIGLGATYHCGSDSYPYYISELRDHGVVGLYSPKSHFKNDWTEGHMVVDPFDPSHKPDIFIRRSYGHWWECTADGKRIKRWHAISFGYACSYQEPSF